ncbi:hypothetical protein [Rheinheimera sp. SA_1]|nr:hypothetical protein [Rheinheimera sp. SA_1]
MNQLETKMGIQSALNSTQAKRTIRSRCQPNIAGGAGGVVGNETEGS